MGILGDLFGTSFYEKKLNQGARWAGERGGQAIDPAMAYFLKVLNSSGLSPGAQQAQSAFNAQSDADTEVGVANLYKRMMDMGLGRSLAGLTGGAYGRENARRKSLYAGGLGLQSEQERAGAGQWLGNLGMGLKGMEFSGRQAALGAAKDPWSMLNDLINTSMGVYKGFKNPAG